MEKSAPQEPQKDEGKENTESEENIDINNKLENALCVVDSKDVRDVRVIGNRMGKNVEEVKVTKTNDKVEDQYHFNPCNSKFKHQNSLVKHIQTKHGMTSYEK